ncbi:hypothetical protein [Nonomuraea ceibae]|uniref:hypothetical protein n=1 Tax=Nonomuraea ceibae TaxID=1935170 RepID=UPI001C5F4C0C|nr:hypothetical protein [Nonomuraea ceibae]
MTEISPLQRSDPADLGGFVLLGRLRHDDRGPVFLARDAGGRHVEVAWLPGGPGAADRVTALTELDAPSLARVLAAGVAGGRAYAVTEHVPGRSLADAVAADGPMTGTTLHRLAIATASALVGLHQGGVTHGDLRPGTVVLGPDGVRVTGYGLAFPPAPTGAPEQVMGPADDVFAWAATILYAATGSADRGLRHEPGLAALEEHLRPAVAAALAEDPAARPDSGDLLLRLIGHSTRTLIPDTAPHSPTDEFRASPEADGPASLEADGPASPAGARPAAPRPASEGHTPGMAAPSQAGAAGRTPGGGAAASGGVAWRGWPGLAAGALAVAVVSAGAGHLIADRVGAASRPVPSPTLSLPDLSVTAAGPRALPSPQATMRAAGIALSLYEHPGDPQRVVAYRNERGTWLRAAQWDGFIEAGVAADDVAASPDGTRVAFQAGRDVTVADRRSGERFTVRVPERAASPVWDRASSRLLLTVSGPKRRTAGFAVLDTATRQARTVPTEGDTGPYAWTPGGDGVVASHDSGGHTGLRFRDLNGREARTMPWTGPSVGRALFSPSGRLMLTDCPSGGSHCAWDAATGVRVATYVNTIKGAEMWGWYDDDHLMILDPGRTPHEFVALDFREGTRRLLATLEAADDTPGLRLARAAR